MKFSSLVTGMGLSLFVASGAYADVVKGSVDAYFSKMYATDLSGKTHLSQHDAACNAKYWYLVNTPFYVDYRVNTEASSHSAFFNYANAEHAMTGVFDKSSGNYVFHATQFSQQLKDMHAKSLSFTVTGDHHWAWAQLALAAPTSSVLTTQTDDATSNCEMNHDMNHAGDCPCDHHDHPLAVSAYQCVLST